MLLNPHLQVAAMVAVLDRDLTNPKKTAEVNIRDLATGSYTSLCKAELTRRIRQIPTAVYAQPPAGLFVAEQFDGWDVRIHLPDK